MLEGYRFRGSRVQRFKGSRVQRFKVQRFEKSICYFNPDFYKFKFEQRTQRFPNGYLLEVVFKTRLTFDRMVELRRVCWLN
jgi:hypothetical protein